nr:FHA domain-containing protein [uncultured Roseateles sp.]
MEKLGVLELLDRDGSVRQYVDIRQWPVRIGRDLQCDLVLDDVHVAAEHAQISLLHSDLDGEPDRLHLTVGNTVNGVLAQGRQLKAGDALLLASGDEWQLGRSRLRLRLATAELAPEQALQAVADTPWWMLALALLAALLWVAGESYVGSEPDGFWSSYVKDGFTVLVGLAVWAALWALVTKLFQHRLEFWRHVWLATLAALVVSVLTFVLALLAYATSIEVLGRLGGVLSSLVLSALIYGHLLVVQPRRGKTLRWFAGGMCALMLASNLGLNWYRFERLSGELYLSQLFPPVLRVAPGASVDQFLDEAKRLQPALERKAKEPVSGFSNAAAPEEEG